MKEIMAIVRSNKVSVTKQALAEAGYAAFTCRRVLGRGKKSVDMALMQTILDAGELPISPIGENLTELGRLISKRIFNLIINEEDVDNVVNTIIEANSSGYPGDGKIFVLPIMDAYRVRNGEKQTDSESY